MLYNRIRRIVPAALLALLCFVVAVPFGTARAQETDTPAYCADLSAENCELLTRSQEAMASLTAATTRVDFQFNVSNVPEAPFEALTLEFAQNSTYEISDAGIEARRQLQQQLQENASAISIEPEEIFQSYTSLMNSIALESETTVTISEDIIALIQAGMEAEGQPVLDIPNTLQLRLRIIDGMYYINISDLAEFMPGLSATGDIWLGFDWAPLLEMALEDAEFDTMTPQEAELFGQMVAASNTSTLAGPLVTSLASTPITVNAISYLVVERLADSVAEGRDVAQFRTTVNYNQLLADPMAQALLAELLRDESVVNQEFSEEEIGQMIEIIQFAGPPILQSLGLEATETIDLESGYVVASEVRMDWDLSQLLALATSFGGADLDVQEVPVVSWNATTTNSGFNEPVAVSAPDTALLFSFEEWMRLSEFE